MNDLKRILKTKYSMPLLMTHFIVGYPTFSKSLDVGRSLVRGGASILEVQIPFSDPIADGPTIVAASHCALKNRITVQDALRLVRVLHAEANSPIVVMSYANPIYRYGISQFVKEAKNCGVSGVIIPDMPFDSKEGVELISACKRYDIYPITVVSPGIPRARLKKIAMHAKGFVYCTSRRGTTGADGCFDSKITQYLENMREIFDLPLAVGFGVRTAKDVSQLAPHAEIIVAGSLFVKAIAKSTDVSEVVNSLIHGGETD